MVDSATQRFARLEARFASVLRHPVCQELRRTLGQRPCHLVGGALRDTALGRPFRDLDAVVAGGGAEVADGLAARLGCRSIKVGGHRFAAYRVTRQGFPIDIWDRGTVSLEADLRRRDFTIHSFALDLHSGALRDPFSGLQDLLLGKLRMTSAEAFADDPLRVMRLCRFASQLVDFHTDPATRARARDSAADLVGVAKERIRTEIEETLAQTGAAIAAELWIDLRVFPEALLHYSLEPPARHSLAVELLRSWRVLERTAADLPLASDLTSARTALLLLQLNAVASLDSASALETLRQRNLVTKARSQQVFRLLEAARLPAGESQQRWYLHRLGDLWPAAVSLSDALVDQETDVEHRSARIAQVIALATQKSHEIFDPPGLISGEDLQRHLAIEPGPALGRLLGLVRRRQIEGTITTRAGALAAAARLYAANGQD